MKAEKYISQRNITVASLCGRSVEFKKGEPTLAPPQMHAELLAMGIVPVEGIMDDEPETSEVAEPSVAEDREKALFDVFEKLVLRERREDFMASGTPHSAVLAKELGWKTIHAKERDAVWAKWTLERAGK